jgi:hypothetical protein
VPSGCRRKVSTQRLVLRHQYVFVDRRDLLIESELRPAIVGFGRFRMHFDDDSRIHNRRHLGIVRIELRTAAYDGDIGIDVFRGL